MLLIDKVSIITGAAQGIGYAIAKMYAENGAVVVLADIQGEAVKRAAANIAFDTGAQTASYTLDICDKTQINNVVADIVKRFKRVDILVNNAGICPHSDILDMEESLWDKVFAVNVKGAFLMTQAAGKFMVLQKSGKIINISSCSGKKPSLGEGAYCSSKSAVIGLTRVTALELGVHGITCNAICPGATDGLMLRTNIITDPETEKEWINKTALKKLGQPEDQAKVAVFLGSSLSDFITGESLIVSAGEIMTQ